MMREIELAADDYLMLSRRPIGWRIAVLRARARVSQQVFADAVGFSKSWLDKVENGLRNPRYSTLIVIAKRLNVNPLIFVATEEDLLDIAWKMARIPRARAATGRSVGVSR